MWWSPHWGFHVGVVIYHCLNKIPSKVLQHNSYRHTAFMCRMLKLVWLLCNKSQGSANVGPVYHSKVPLGIHFSTRDCA